MVSSKVVQIHTVFFWPDTWDQKTLLQRPHIYWCYKIVLHKFIWVLSMVIDGQQIISNDRMFFKNGLLRIISVGWASSCTRVTDSIHHESIEKWLGLASLSLMELQDDVPLSKYFLSRYFLCHSHILALSIKKWWEEKWIMVSMWLNLLSARYQSVIPMLFFRYGHFLWSCDSQMAICSVQILHSHSRHPYFYICTPGMVIWTLQVSDGTRILILTNIFLTFFWNPQNW